MNARQFWNVVLRSGALGESESRRAVSQWQLQRRSPDADAPADIAQWLQSHGFLTALQARRLLLHPSGSLRIGRYVLVDQHREGFFAQAYWVSEDSNRRLLDTLAIAASPLAVQRVGDANVFLQRHVELHHPHLQTCREVLSGPSPQRPDDRPTPLQPASESHAATAQVWRLVLDPPPGESLANRRFDRQLHEWCERFRQWTEALQAMHDAGLVHGRIGPGALFCAEDTVLLARRPCRPTTYELWTDAPTKTMLADAACLPPELVLHRAVESPATDVFALGAAFLFACTGNLPLTPASGGRQPPVSSPFASTGNLPLASASGGRQPPVSSPFAEQLRERALTWGTDRPVLLCDLPGDWQRLFHDLLHESPEHRIQSAQELAQRLDEIEPGRLIPHIETDPLPRIANPQRRTWLGGRRSWQAAMGVLLVGLVGWLLSSWRNPPSRTSAINDGTETTPAVPTSDGTTTGDMEGTAERTARRRGSAVTAIPPSSTRLRSAPLWLRTAERPRWPLAACPPGAECFLWLRPRDGLALPEGERLVRSLDALQPWRLVPAEFPIPVAWSDAVEAVICLVPQEEGRWRMTVGLQLHPEAKWPEAWSRDTSNSPEPYLVGPERVEGKPTADSPGAPNASEAAVLVLSQSDRRVVMGPLELLEPLAKALPAEPLLRRDLERLWGRTSHDQVAGCLFTPRFLKPDGLALLPPPLRNLATMAASSLEDGLLAGMAAIRLDAHEAFVEVHLVATLERRQEILDDLLQRLSAAPAAIETILVEAELADPAWRRFALRLAPMARFVAEHARYRLDKGQITLLFSLPAAALHNLSLGLQFPR